MIMPVLTEQLLIAQTLAATRQVVGDAELTVVDGGSAERTAQRVAIGCRVGAARGAMFGALCAAHV